MTKKIYLTDKRFLPEITEADNAFALDVKKIYRDISFNELVWLIREVRSTLEDNEFQENILEHYNNVYTDLLAPDIEIKAFHVVTNKKTVRVHPDIWLFPYFIDSVEKIKTGFEKRNKADLDYFISVPGRSAFMKVNYYIFIDPVFLFKNSLSNWKKRILLGLFIVHFNLLNKTWKDKKAWQNKPTNNLSYNHYLADMVKSLLKNSHYQFE